MIFVYGIIKTVPNIKPGKALFSQAREIVSQYFTENNSASEFQMEVCRAIDVPVRSKGRLIREGQNQIEDPSIKALKKKTESPKMCLQIRRLRKSTYQKHCPQFPQNKQLRGIEAKVTLSIIADF